MNNIGVIYFLSSRPARTRPDCIHARAARSGRWIAPLDGGRRAQGRALHGPEVGLYEEVSRGAHSAFTPEALMTRAQRSWSFLRNAANSAGVSARSPRRAPSSAPASRASRAICAFP